MSLKRNILSFLALGSLLAVIAGCSSGAKLAGHPENPQSVYTAQTPVVLNAVKTKTKVKGHKFGTYKVAVAPLYLDVRFQDGIVAPKGKTAYELDAWWSTEKGAGDWAFKRIANRVHNNISNGLKKRGLYIYTGTTTSKVGAQHRIGRSDVPSGKFARTVNFHKNKYGRTAAYTAHGGRYFDTWDGPKLVQKMADKGVDSIVMVRIITNWDKQRSRTSQTNKERYINYPVYFAIGTYHCNSKGCFEAVTPVDFPLEMTIPVPDFHIVTSKDSRNANSVFSENLTINRLTDMALAQIDMLVKKK